MYEKQLVLFCAKALKFYAILNYIQQLANLRHHTLPSYLREKKHFSFHLKSEFVLFIVFECPHFVDNIFQIGFDKVDCRLKSLSNCLFRSLGSLVVVVTETSKSVSFHYFVQKFIYSNVKKD